MKKLLFVGLLFGLIGVAKADSLCTDWGKFNLCLPVTTGVDAAFGYDFRGHQSQGLAETGFGTLGLGADSRIVFKVGGITSESGKGAPFLGFDYELKGISNPVPGFASIHPGIYGGRDFHENEDFYGVKFSMPIISSN